MKRLRGQLLAWEIEDEEAPVVRRPNLYHLRGWHELHSGPRYLKVDGVRFVNQFLEAAYSRTLPTEFDWRFTTAQGNLVTRIDRYLKREHQIKLSADTKAQIGTTLSRLFGYRQDEAGYTINIRQGPFNWPDCLIRNRRCHEVFGHTGSCWWKWGHKDRFAKREGFAILWFTRPWPTCEADVGRLWAHQLEADVFAVFNGYMQDGIFTTARMASLLASYLGMETREARACSLFSHLNHSRCYVIGPSAKLRRYTHGIVRII